jgi:predicted ATP-grasp superfamily ATP-dependent carboligase
MRNAVLRDLVAHGGHGILATVDPRFPIPRDLGVPSAPGRGLDRLLASVDAVWLVAPETGGCLEILSGRARSRGVRLLGSGPAAIRRAADKSRLPRRLARAGIPHPETLVLAPGMDPERAARRVGYPLVLKPAQGAGSVGVFLARTPRDLARIRGRLPRRGRILVQRFVRGRPASVSLLGDGRRAVALAVNGQDLSPSLEYRGGCTPLDHALSGEAVRTAERVARALPGLTGYFGVDMVLTETEAVVIEVNPRLTTSYLGVRVALGENVARLALGACDGSLPEPPPVRRRVRFTASGTVAGLR